MIMPLLYTTLKRRPNSKLYLGQNLTNKKLFRHHPAFPPFALPLIRTRLLPTLVDQRLPQPSCQSEIKYCSRAYISSSNTRLLMKLMKSADNIITGIVCLLVYFLIPIIIMHAVRAEMKYINVICP